MCHYVGSSQKYMIKLEKRLSYRFFFSGRYTRTVPLAAKRKSGRFSFKLGVVKGFNGHNYEYADL